MNSRGKAGAAYAHVAALLRAGEPLPPGEVAWLAERLARVADVLLDGARPDTDVVKALGARNRQGRRPGMEKRARDAELVEAVVKAQCEYGKSQADAFAIVTLERKELAEQARSAFAGMEGVEGLAKALEVSERKVRRAVETSRKR